MEFKICDAVVTLWISKGWGNNRLRKVLLINVLQPASIFQLLGWLSEKLPNSKKLPPELNECIPHLYACLEDRNADVRKKAQEALVPFMVQVGFESMVRKVGQLKASSILCLIIFFKFANVFTVIQFQISLVFLL